MNITTTLEQRLSQNIKAGEVSVERAMLIASGLDSEEAIQQYTARLDTLQKRFHDYLERKKRHPNTQMETARELFDYLWEDKPRRNDENGDYKLTTAIDAQLSEDKNLAVGNCIALTALFTALGLREGLNLYATYIPGHVLSTLRKNGSLIIDIENTRTDGYNTRLDESYGYVEESAMHIVSLMIASRWQIKKEGREEQLNAAIKDYNLAIEISPNNAVAYCHRGIAEARQHRFNEALKDAEKALKIFPNYEDAEELKKFIDRSNKTIAEIKPLGNPTSSTF